MNAAKNDKNPAMRLLKMSLFLIVSFAALGFQYRAQATDSLDPYANETTAQRDARMAWWRDARFGMFIHWGVYSVPAGEWNGKDYGGYAEHIQRMAKIPIPVYRKEVAGKFNPVDFNADEWIRLAKEAGMGYFIITAKHHDGFAMYDSQVSD